jgi:hypothetical protein
VHSREAVQQILPGQARREAVADLQHPLDGKGVVPRWNRRVHSAVAARHGRHGVKQSPKSPVDLFRGGEHLGEILIEDNSPALSPFRICETVRLRLPVVKSVLRAQIVGRWDRVRECFLHSLAALGGLPCVR